MNKNKIYRILLIMLLLINNSLFADTATPLFQVAIDKMRFIKLQQEASSIAVGNPDIADIQLVDKKHLYILGKGLGSTNVTLTNAKAEDFMMLNVEVTHDIDGLKAKLHELLPSEQPNVYSSQRAIVLSGQISSAEKMDAILAIAKTYLHQDNTATATPSLTATVTAPAPAPASNNDASIINMMQVGGPQQVMLEVKVAEMNRTLAKNLNVNFNMMHTGSNASGGAVSGRANIANPVTNLSGALVPVTENVQNGQLFSHLTDIGSGVINPFGLFARFIGHDMQSNAVINASRSNGLIKILAEPTLTTISGQAADFLSGGEFPIPVQKNTTGGITVDYKEFGVATKFLPVVLDSGRISLKLSIDVSEISDVSTVVASVSNTQNSFVIPALSKRRANSSVELEDGQTIGIAGLISDNLRDSVNKFPAIGDIPVLGQLFTSQQFLKNQTELVIFVTPRLAKPMPTATPKLPTDNFVEPSDAEYYLMGRTEAQGQSKRPVNASVGAGGLVGHFGQQP